VGKSDTSGASESAAATSPLDSETAGWPDWNSGATVAAPAVTHTASPAVATATDGEPKGRTLPRWAPEVIVLVALLAGGVAVTWPRATYLTGKLPLDGDQMQYVWNFWWVAKQVTHLGNPWFTNYMAAPVGVRLGYDTLTPLLGIVMTPVTLLFGPATSYNLVATLASGLAAYAMYRAARLWLPSRTGAIAAGAFYGYSSMLTSQAWLHLHTAMGCVFLPLTLEAAVRLRRRPGTAQGIVLGVVVGCAVLVDQELGVLAIVVAVLALLPWLVRHLDRPGFWASVVAAVSAVVVSSPQLYAMVRAGGKGGPSTTDLYSSYSRYTASLPALFAPSPHLASYGLTGLASIYSSHMTAVARAYNAHEEAATFGVVLTVTALLGLIAAWRRRGTGRLALLWLGSIILALGPALIVSGRTYTPLATTWHGIRVSLLMPYTWLIRLPVLSSFREADRLALIGLVGAALLAGAAVDWLRWNGRPLIIGVAVLGALEAGWSGIQGDRTVPATLPAVDGPIAADHSGSVVLDVPFLISGPARYGTKLPPYALNLAAEDGHPRAMSFSSGVPQRTIEGIKAHPFYSGLVEAEKNRKVTPEQLAAARQDLRTLHIGWVVIWPPNWIPSFPVERHKSNRLTARDRQAIKYLTATGFRFDYQADGVLVYRPGKLLTSR
jgi:Dolichyl-phosphate-mannose-protein mannosyltransferase